MYCKYCGQPADYTKRFCANCGNPIDSNVSKPVSPAVQSSPPSQPPSTGHFVSSPGETVVKQVSKRSFGNLAIVVILLGAIVAGYFMFLAPKPEKVIYKFADAFNSMDLKTMFSCLDPKEEALYNSLPGLVGSFTGLPMDEMMNLVPFLIDEGQSAGEIGEYKMTVKRIVSKEVSGDDAIVHAEIHIRYDDKDSGLLDETQVVKFVLKKFDQGWRIMNFDDL